MDSARSRSLRVASWWSLRIGVVGAEAFTWRLAARPYFASAPRGRGDLCVRGAMQGLGALETRRLKPMSLGDVRVCPV
jgi:hypothetical protein